MSHADEADTADRPDVLSEVRQRYDELTNSQKRIAEAIVEDPEFVAFATVDKLASRLGVAPSTVVRFAYKIGLRGYQELQERVQTGVRAQMRAYSGIDDGERAVAGHLRDTGHDASLLHDMDNLRQTIAGLQAETVDAAVDALVAAQRVFVVGGFTSEALANYASLALDRIRGTTFLVQNDPARHIPTLVELSRADALLVYGFVPYSSNSVRVLDLAKAAGTRLIGITDTSVSPVGQRVDVVLSVRVSGLGPQNSLVAPLAVTNAVLNGVTTRLPDAVDRYGNIMDTMNAWDLFELSGMGNAGS